MKDIKAITIPEGTVKKIEDANGNIIWGSQSAFPYRRLEYIEGDGNNYIITSSVVTTGGNVGYWFQMAFHQASPSNALSGCEKSNAYTTNDRFKFGTGGGGKLYCGYANGFSATQAPVQDRFYEFYAKQGTQYIKDLTTNTNVVTGSYSLTGTNIGSGHVTLFGLAQGSDTNITQIANNAGTRIKLYKIIYNNVLHVFVPAQRKSDGKCVFIDTYNGRIFEEQGSGALIPGPVADEYWDLTAPS